MYLLDQRQKDAGVMKQEYLAELKKKANLLDADFYKYASDPKNIVIAERMECDVIVRAEVKLTMDYREWEYTTRVKGFNVEARSDKVYVTADKDTDSGWEKKSQSFRFTVEKRFNYKDGSVRHIDGEDASTDGLVRMDEREHADAIAECLRRCGVTDVYAIQSAVTKKLTSKYNYNAEAKRAEEEIGTDRELYKDFSLRSVELTAPPFRTDDSFAIIFRRLYKVGVRYNGQEYMTDYYDTVGQLSVIYSREAVQASKVRAKKVRAALILSAAGDALAFLIVFGIALAVFIVNARLSAEIYASEKFVEDWMSALADFPNTLVALIPWIATLVAFIVLMAGWYEEIIYTSTEPSDMTAREEIKYSKKEVGKKRKLFATFAFVTLLFAAVQGILTAYILS